MTPDMKELPAELVARPADQALVPTASSPQAVSTKGFDPSRAFVVPWTPTEAQWGGLARQIMLWLDFGDRRTPRSLFRHLALAGHEIPQWLRDEPEMRALDHVPSKGTRCVLIYRAMLAASGMQLREDGLPAEAEGLQPGGVAETPDPKSIPDLDSKEEGR